ncbi:HAMP domain-containing protein [Vibrio vulnificus]|nr:HAMP domain-containing protein [Vibrio vulnificus]EHH1181809.1 HAMP domain-containing protein [Vibrio vulnificus]EIJ0984976.1 HAMP domain-containing protein [Vibrio vulnificus]HAS8388824.1 HAMP domain-containing protein [Vibrio vulnificus]
MKRIYLEAFFGLILLFFATLWGYEVIVYQLNTDYDRVLTEFEINAFHDLLTPLYQEKGQAYFIEAMENYAEATRSILTIYEQKQLPKEIAAVFVDPAMLVYLDDDFDVWMRFSANSTIYHLKEDLQSPLRQAIDFSGNLVWVFFIIGFAIYCVILIWFLSRRVRELERVTLAFASGDLSARARTTARYSVGSLNKSFNVMADKIANLITSNKVLTNAVAHELRTPIFRLQWQADLLADSPLTEMQQKSVSSMVEDIDEMEAMVEEMLYYAKMERPEAQLHTQAISLLPWCETLVRKWQSETYHPIHLQIDSCCDQANVDPHLVKRALDNLVRNAMRYTQTQVRIQVTHTAEQLEFQVHDDGKGVAEQDWPYLFDAFYSADKSRNKSTSGYGLGLAIVKQICQIHNGSAQVAHSPLGGACFIIRFSL